MSRQLLLTIFIYVMRQIYYYKIYYHILFISLIFLTTPLFNAICYQYIVLKYDHKFISLSLRTSTLIPKNGSMPLYRQYNLETRAAIHHRNARRIICRYLCTISSTLGLHITSVWTAMKHEGACTARRQYSRSDIFVRYKVRSSEALQI